MKRARFSATLRPLAGAAVLGLGCLSAHAQTSTIDPGIASSDSIGASELQAIQRHVSEWGAGLSSDDMGQIATSRQRLSRPLSGSSVAVTFREAYADALVPELETLIASDNIGSRLAALRLAGELATEGSVTLLIDALEDSDDAVRYFSIGRIESAFAQAAAHPPSLSPETTLDVVRLLSEKLGSESPLEADAAVRSLGGALRIDRAGYEPARNEAAVLLGSGAGERVRGIDTSEMDESEIIVALNACSAARSAVTASGWKPDAQGTRELIGLGGDVLALVFERFVNQELPDVDGRAIDIQTVRAAENLIHFARRHDATLRGASDARSPTRLGDLLESGDDRAFQNQALELLGRTGDLVGDYSFQPDRFVAR